MKSFRIEKVSSELKRMVSDAIRDELQDPRIAVITSVTHVEVSRDLEHAKVYVSVLGSPAEQSRTMAALHSARGYVQRLVARELNVRQCPHIVFCSDDSIKKANEVLRLINESMDEINTDAARRQAEASGPDEGGDETAP